MPPTRFQEEQVDMDAARVSWKPRLYAILVAVVLAASPLPAQAEVLVADLAAPAVSMLPADAASGRLLFGSRRDNEVMANGSQVAAGSPMDPRLVFAMVLVVPAGTGSSTASASSTSATSLSSVVKSPTSQSGASSNLETPVGGVATITGAPEPGSLLLGLAGIAAAGLGVLARRRAKGRAEAN
jgi:hypothetical protein